MGSLREEAREEVKGFEKDVKEIEFQKEVEELQAFADRIGTYRKDGKEVVVTGELKELRDEILDMCPDLANEI